MSEDVVDASQPFWVCDTCSETSSTGCVYLGEGEPLINLICKLDGHRLTCHWILIAGTVHKIEKK